MNNPFTDLPFEHTQEINLRFQTLESKDDFYALLTDLLADLPMEEAKKNFYLQWIKVFVQSDYARRYNFFIIKKASGKDRVIHSPDEILKFIQRLFNIVLNAVFTAHPCSFGFKKGSSIAGNAAIHIDCNYVFNIDLLDFFSTIDQRRIRESFSKPPFNLTGSKAALAEHLSKLTCISLRVVDQNGAVRILPKQKVLPQGAPTSPAISNIVCLEMDEKLHALALKFNLNYSRYADDITFSSNKYVYKDNSRFRNELEKVICESGFRINPAKTRLQKKHNRQVVTGLVVNEKVNVKREYVKSLRMYLRYWERYGYEKAEVLYNNDAGPLNFDEEPKSLYSMLKGRIDFLRMVKGKESGTYRQFMKRWYKLTNPNQKTLQSRESYFKAHKPKDVSLFLRLFQDSAGLKYLTHDYDVYGSKFNYDYILGRANVDFNAGFQKYAITKTLYARIKQFAFSKNPSWWRWENGQKITYNSGWKSVKMIQWVKDNPGVHPFKFKKFRDEMIFPFKESIQVRVPKLRTLMEESIREKFQASFSEFDITYENLESAEFYTDVDVVLGGIRHLLDGIIERAEVSNKVLINFKRAALGAHDLKILTISHLDSFCYKEARADQLGNGNFIEAKKAFRGLCNWTITSKFADGAFTLYMLTDNPDQPERMPVRLSEPKGFTHSLFFY